MGRRSSRPAAPRRSRAPAPARRQSSSSAAPPPAKSSAAAPPAPAAAPPAAAGGGFMSQVASTAAGVAIGRGIDRAFFGGGGGGGAESEPQEYEAAAAAPAGGVSSFGPEGAPGGAACTRFMEDFKTCMESSGYDAATCKWPMELLANCQAEQGGLAEANRF